MSTFSVAARPMMRPTPFSASRLVLRPRATRRFESTDAAAKAQQAASSASAKAAQGLSRVSAAAGPAISSAAKNLSGALGRVGGRTGKVIAFVERQTPFVVYYSRVGLELGKLVFKNQKMAPPSLDVFQSYFQNAWKQIQNPSKLIQSPATLLQQVRAVTPTQLAAAGVVGAELLGFFTIGEIIGRFKLIGYHGQVAHHE